MKRALITLAAVFAVSLPSAALATVYVVYTSGFDVTSTTGCDYGGTSGSLVTLANGSEGCMVEAGMAADDGDEAAAALMDVYEDPNYQGGYGDDVYEEQVFETRR